MSKYVYSKTIESNGYVRKVRKFYDCLPEHAKWLMHENQVKFHEVKPLKKVLEPTIFTDVDALRYLGVVRHFICGKYNITQNELELFLFLYPYNFFTKRDYDRIAPIYYKCALKTLLKREHIIAIYKKENLTVPEGKKKDLADIYTLSLKAKRAVTYFYRIIAGEVKPFKFESAQYYKSDKKNELIKDLLEEIKHNS